MAYAGTIENRVHDSFSRAGHAALSGPGVGAVLLGSLVFFNEASFRFGDMHQASLDWQIALRLLVCLACGLYGLAHLGQTADTLLRFPGVWTVLFASWAIVTIPLAMNLTYAVATTATLVCVILFAPAAIQQLGGRRIIESTLIALSIYMVLSWVAYFAVPSLGRTEYVLPDLSVVERFGGLNHGNTTGRLAALAIGLLLILGVQKVARWRNVCLGVIGFGASLYFTDSRTTMIAAAAVVFLFAVRFGSPRLRSMMVAAVPVGAILIGIGLLSGILDINALMGKIARTGDANELYSLTGRTSVWESVIVAIGENPIFGYGQGCTRLVMAAYNERLGQDLAGYHAHNLFLNIVLGTGIIGGLLLLAMFASQAIGFLKRPDLFPDVMLVLTAVSGVSDAVMLNLVPDSYTLLWLIAMYWRQMGAKVVAEAESPQAVGVGA